MASSQKCLDEILEKLEVLYGNADLVMVRKTSTSKLISILKEINILTVELDKIGIKLQSSDEPESKNILLRLKEQYVVKAEFDIKATDWLKSMKVSSIEIASTSGPRTLRSNVSQSTTSTSTHSSSSSASKAKLVAKEELARLMLQHLEERLRIESEESDRKRKEAEEDERRKHNLEMLKARQELEQASLKRQVVEEELDRGGYLAPDRAILEPSRVVAGQNSVKFNDHLINNDEINRPGKLAGPSPRHYRDGMDKTTALLRESLDEPKIELSKFRGEPMQYTCTRFIKTFEANIESSLLDPNKRLLLLIQHYEGEAKKMIEFCSLLEPSVGYIRAKAILEENFGRKNVIARSFLEKLQQGPVLRPDDKQGIMQLARELEECNITLSQLKYASYLNNLEIMTRVVKRLPYQSQTRWIRRAADIERTGEDPTFEDLVCFVKAEAEVARSTYACLLLNRVGKSSKMQVHSMSVNESPISAPACNPVKCYLCFGNHKLSNCTRFRSKSHADKIAFLRQNRLCDNCFSKGHVARFCRSSRICCREGCQEKHHSLLHRSHRLSVEPESRATTSQSTVGLTKAQSTCSMIESSEQSYLNIVPVTVFSGDRQVSCYAFLDQGSTTTLCSQKLIDQLEIRGEDAHYTISTINHTMEWRKGKRVSLEVSPLNGDQFLQLPDVYCIDEIPVAPNPSLTVNDLEVGIHFKNLTIPSLNNAEVLLLVGTDVPEVFWTMEERRGNPKHPYALKTILGWSLIGPRTTSKRKNCLVNFYRMSDQLLDEQVKCLWKKEELPEKIIGRGLFKQDKYALKLVSESKEFQKGHYQLALPWRPGAPTLSSNYDYARNRLARLKKRLEANADLKHMYVNAMNEYITKGFAREWNQTSDKNDEVRCWFLPHHPVFNINKPNKVRVVFDCAAQCKGESLNNQLLPGPDLLNSLVGVLCRFRREAVAVVSDVEGMFNQVRTKPGDHRYLKFLWWKDGNLQAPVTEYCMQVHLFGATSSPFCAIFALHQTAEDNLNEFEEEVIATVKDNFYIDDMLKSVSTVEKALKLIPQVTNLLSKGGFRLTKWLRNREEVLNTIPEEERSKSATHLFDCAKVSGERNLGVHWDFKNDNLFVAVTNKRKPFTRRGILSVISMLFDPLGFTAPVI